MQPRCRQMRKKAGFELVRQLLQGGLRFYAALFLDSFPARAYCQIRSQAREAHLPTTPGPPNRLR